MTLTHLALKQANRREKAYKLYDTGSLYCLIHPNGGRYWRFDYRFHQKRKTIAPGTYPLVSLRDARALRDTMKRQLFEGIDPGAKRKAAKAAARRIISFEDAAQDWMKRYEQEWSVKHRRQLASRLRRYAYPILGKRTCEAIGPLDILRVCRQAESKGHHEVAHKLRQYCGQVMRYAVANGWASRDPSPDIKGALTPKPTRHFATLTQPSRIAELLIAIDSYSSTATRCALQLLALTFVRPGELRQARWEEFDLDQALWRIPPERMKMKRAHLVPLSRQALETLSHLPRYPITTLLFPSVQRRKRPVSEGTFNKAIRQMGFSKEEFTSHGFRGMASTRLNEAGWDGDVIERRLAHVEGNAARAAYNHAQYLDQRRTMMQAWADSLDTLREQVNTSQIAHA